MANLKCDEWELCGVMKHVSNKHGQRVLSRGHSAVNKMTVVSLRAHAPAYRLSWLPPAACGSPRSTDTSMRRKTAYEMGKNCESRGGRKGRCCFSYHASTTPLNTSTPYMPRHIFNLSLFAAGVLPDPDKCWTLEPRGAGPFTARSVGWL